MNSLKAKTESAPVDGDRGLLRGGIALLRSLPSTADRRVLLRTDVHAGDVLAHLLNCGERRGADPWGLARRMAALLELDHDRLMLWLFARCAQESPNSPGRGELARRIAPT
jgi:streptomycin 6-kinase